MLGCFRMEEKEREGKGKRIKGHARQWGLCWHLSDWWQSTGPREERKWIEKDIGVCASVCFCVRVCFGLRCGGKRGMTDKRDDANRDEACKQWRARQGEAEWGRMAGTMRRGITPSRSLYQPECTFRRDRAREKKREEGSSGTPTKSEKVKERYMICRE